MPNILLQPGSIYSDGANSLDDQIEQAKVEVSKQRETIARLAAEDREVPDAQKQLKSMLENLVFLVKLQSHAT
jgi:hypothetical protein